MPIDVKTYEAAKGELEALCNRFPRNRELAEARTAFCDPSYPRPLIEDAAGEAFRKRQRAAEDNFNEFLAALHHAMRAVDSEGAEKICKAIFKWQREKNKASFQDRFEEFKEEFMPHAIKEQLKTIFDQTLDAVKSYRENLVGYSEEAKRTVSGKELAYYDEVYEKLSELRGKLENANITDTDKSLAIAEEIRKSLAILRDKLPSGVSSRLRVFDELGVVEDAFKSGRQSILSLGGKPVDEKHCTIAPFTEIGREHKQIVKGVDELEAASFVLGTLRHYSAFLADLTQKRNELRSRPNIQNVNDDPDVQTAYRNYGVALNNARSVPPTSPQYNDFVLMLRKAEKDVEDEIADAMQRMKENSIPDDEAAQLMKTIRKDFERVVKHLMSNVFGNYRQRYQSIVENGIYDLGDLYDELQGAVLSNKKDRVVSVRAKIDTIIDRLTVKMDPIVTLDTREPVKENPMIYEPVKKKVQEPIVQPEDLVDKFQWLSGSGAPVHEAPVREAPVTGGTPVLTRETPVSEQETAIAEDPSAQHVNVAPVEETGSTENLNVLLNDLKAKK